MSMCSKLFETGALAKSDLIYIITDPFIGNIWLFIVFSAGPVSPMHHYKTQPYSITNRFWLFTILAPQCQIKAHFHGHVTYIFSVINRFLNDDRKILRLLILWLMQFPTWSVYVLLDHHGKAGFMDHKAVFHYCYRDKLWTLNCLFVIFIHKLNSQRRNPQIPIICLVRHRPGQRSSRVTNCDMWWERTNRIKNHAMYKSSEWCINHHSDAQGALHV